MSTNPGNPAPKEPAVGYVHSSNLNELLNRLELSLLVSTYQAQRVLLFSAGKEKLYMLMRTFERPTGIAFNNARQLALCAKNKIWIFYPAGTVFDDKGAALPHDLYLVPRLAHVTGDIAGHELAWLNDALLVVNTRFSCLCHVGSPAWSFQPIWKPRFISKIVAEDRCHLNGVALDASGPKFVTALGQSDIREGWRPERAKSGIIIDVASGEVITTGLAMPHSPRIYAGKLWVLNSGAGELATVDPASGKLTTVVRLPGYLRGLDFYDRFAFIGCSKIREKSTFGGMPIEERVAELQCSVYVLDISTGKEVGFINFNKGIEELFDIKIIPKTRAPYMVGFEDDTVDGLFVIPPAG